MPRPLFFRNSSHGMRNSAIQLCKLFSFLFSIIAVSKTTRGTLCFVIRTLPSFKYIREAFQAFTCTCDPSYEKKYVTPYADKDWVSSYFQGKNIPFRFLISINPFFFQKSGKLKKNSSKREEKKEVKMAKEGFKSIRVSKSDRDTDLAFSLTSPLAVFALTRKIMILKQYSGFRF